MPLTPFPVSIPSIMKHSTHQQLNAAYALQVHIITPRTLVLSLRFGLKGAIGESVERVDEGYACRSGRVDRHHELA
jgi:hypothetical protein